ncbi:NAD(P)-dependent oxidoreductase [Fulvivirgaceae bacterium PWU4]|uniref:NAD(P)-dependent oxidoreductase n=1 Tax=Chryseosolibacter histidini TaxID=2782349 RepID=A0AAP2DL92_9BACT|nr:NAD(P)-dependent oxidoreductase [Chryseosolibacter histidini]MBT1698431.1 NAD(P)-dependent oxidoreductase [Chryseosolibacter histidini]
MKERVLITGASGFVGYHLIEESLRKGLEVYAAVRSTSAVDHLKALPIRFTTTDFSDAKALREDLEANQYDYVIHAAGATKAASEEDYMRVNAEYTRNLGEAIAAVQLPLRKFVFLSSLAAAGPSQNRVAITEHDREKPVTWYGKSKLQAEGYLSGIHTLPVVTLRPTAVYGPRDRDIFILLKTFAQGLEPYIGWGEQQLSFVYVKDLASVTIDALRSNITGKTYNVADGRSYDRYELANITKEILKLRTFRVHIPTAMVRALALVQETAGKMRGNIPALNRNKIAELTANWSCSIDNICKDLGFMPRYSLENGLAETIQWYKDNQWLK